MVGSVGLQKELIKKWAGVVKKKGMHLRNLFSLKSIHVWGSGFLSIFRRGGGLLNCNLFILVLFS